MNTVFSQNLKLLLSQMNLTGAQLAKAINVDPSLVSRWLRSGCGERKASVHALAVGRYIASRRLSPQRAAWLAAALGCADAQDITAERIAVWLYPDADVPAAERTDEASGALAADGFRGSESESSGENGSAAVLGICRGADEIAALLTAELEKADAGARVLIYLSSESIAAAVDRQTVAALRQAVEQKTLSIHMLVQSANNSAMSNRLIGAYMPLLVQGRLTLSVVQGTPQVFTASMHVLIPGRSVIVVTEAVGKRAAAVAAVVREAALVYEMTDNFSSAMRYARPMMTVYGDSFARNIIEAFFEEYGMPGGLDVVKSGLSPMYLTAEQYGKILRDYGHTDDQYQWRYSEFVRFKTAMAGVLASSRFREILSLSKLREIAETGRCRMPAMYFMETGVWYLDAEDCLAVLDGYIRHLKEIPDYHIALSEDDSLFVEDSCWHIKNNKHVMIHSWNRERPVMVYSDQLLLIDEFQRHFDALWGRVGSSVGNKRAALETLTELRTALLKRTASVD